MHVSDDALVRRALGEPAPDVDVHTVDRSRCRAELTALTATVHAGRSAGPGGLPPAPDGVWSRIATELELPARPVPGYRADDSSTPAPRRWLRPALVAAAAALVVGVAAVALLAPQPAVRTSTLVPVAASGPVAPGATATARLSDAAGEQVLTVEARALPDVDGFYEVWLLDPATGRMLALGTLEDDGTARLPVPPVVNPGSYPTVDVSVEKDDGDPAHSGISALRGPVPV